MQEITNVSKETYFKFSNDLKKLLVYAHKLGYQVMILRLTKDKPANKISEIKADPNEDFFLLGLGIELQLFFNSKPAIEYTDYLVIADYWVRKLKNKWGGDFKRPRYNHHQFFVAL